LAHDLLRRYLEEEVQRAETIQRTRVECEVSVSIGPNVTLAGRIDRLDELNDGRIRIIDYKTGQLDSRPAYLAGLQIPAYAWLATKSWRKELESVEVISLKALKELARGTEINRQVLPWNDGSKYALTPERLDEVREETARIVQGVRAGQFEPRPDEQRCSWCSYRLLCDQAWGARD
jgi:RecB family exonuclease